MYNRKIGLPPNTAVQAVVVAATLYLREVRGEMAEMYNLGYGPYKIGFVRWMLDASSDVWLMVSTESVEIFSRNDQDKGAVDYIVDQLKEKFPAEPARPVHPH